MDLRVRIIFVLFGLLYILPASIYFKWRYYDPVLLMYILIPCVILAIASRLVICKYRGLRKSVMMQSWKDYIVVFTGFGLSLALNITTIVDVWRFDWEIAVGLTGWAIAAIIITLVLTIVDNSVFLRTNIGFIYDN